MEPSNQKSELSDYIYSTLEPILPASYLFKAYDICRREKSDFQIQAALYSLSAVVEVCKISLWYCGIRHLLRAYW